MTTLPSTSPAEHDVTCHCRDFQQAGYSSGPTLAEYGALYGVAFAARDLFDATTWRARFQSIKTLRSRLNTLWRT